MTSNPPTLSHEEIKRYSRHLIMPEVGMEGQLKLREARILLIGAGGLGSPSALYLTAAGIGHLGIVDFDQVDPSNLQRQILHTTKDVGRPKTESAKDTLLKINPHIEITTHQVHLTSENALDIIKEYDVVVDGSDNFPTRYLVNDATVLLGKPNVYGSIFRFEGQASVFHAAKGPCYRCLFPEPPPPGMVPSCAEGGVLGILPGIVGTIQATEAIKLVLGQGRPLIGRLLMLDALEMSFREVELVKDPDCPVCGPNPTIKELIDYEGFCGLDMEEGVELGVEWDITPEELRIRLERKDEFLLLDVRNPNEYQICHIPGARLLPLSQLQNRVNELDTVRQIVLYCHKGKRSAKALETLRDMGFKKLKNLVGGINAWAETVDPTTPRY